MGINAERHLCSRMLGLALPQQALPRDLRIPSTVNFLSMTPLLRNLNPVPDFGMGRSNPLKVTSQWFLAFFPCPNARKSHASSKVASVILSIFF